MFKSIVCLLTLSICTFCVGVFPDCCFALEDDGQWGNLTGQIVVVGDKPAIKKETIDKDQSTCLSGKEPPMDDNLLIAKDGGLKDVFVMMYLKGDKPDVHPSYEESLKSPVVLDNKNCRFQPHALFVRTGQALQLKKQRTMSGTTVTSCCSYSEENINIPTGEHVEVKLNEAEKVPGNVVCDIHKWMDSVLLVRDEPYVAITNASGKFEIRKYSGWQMEVSVLAQKKLATCGNWT